MLIRVLTWNLFHGRAVPGAGRELRGEFTAALAGWEWDLALLQEVPPWWPARLADALGCEQRRVLTSRNLGQPVRRALALRAPDLMRSGGGGCNAILARSDRIIGDRSLRLRRRPERRWVHAVQLASGFWVANLHATVHDPAAAAHELDLAAETALGWANGAPLILGGDLNERAPATAGLSVVASSDVDHVLVSRGTRALGAGSVLDAGPLSDHAPLTVELELLEP